MLPNKLPAGAAAVIDPNDPPLAAEASVFPNKAIVGVVARESQNNSPSRAATGLLLPNNPPAAGAGAPPPHIPPGKAAGAPPPNVPPPTTVAGSAPNLVSGALNAEATAGAAEPNLLNSAETGASAGTEEQNDPPVALPECRTAASVILLNNLPSTEVATAAVLTFHQWKHPNQPKEILLVACSKSMNKSGISRCRSCSQRVQQEQIP